MGDVCWIDEWKLALHVTVTIHATRPSSGAAVVSVVSHHIEHRRCIAKRMSKHTGPDLKKYMEKNVLVKMNGKRTVKGVLRGYDQFMNLVLDNATEDAENAKDIGMVVIRGNSVVQLEVIPWTGN